MKMLNRIILVLFSFLCLEINSSLLLEAYKKAWSPSQSYKITYDSNIKWMKLNNDAEIIACKGNIWYVDENYYEEVKEKIKIETIYYKEPDYEKGSNFLGLPKSYKTKSKVSIY